MDFFKNAIDQSQKPTNSTSTHEADNSNNNASNNSNNNSDGKPDLFGMLSGAIGGSKASNENKQESGGSGSGGGGGGVMGMFNHALGGGAKGEEKEDKLDKALDLFQEHVLKQGPQNNENAIEQHKDEMISDAIRDQYKRMTGNEFFVPDK